MNCDDVFEALTDPALCQSAQFEGHLAKCPRCRQLQQVLEPARSLLCGNLPAEPGPAAESRNESHIATRLSARQAPLLSVEAVGLAEAIAAQLASSSGGKSVPSQRRVASRRNLIAALRSAALVLFGALAVYCIGTRDRDSDFHSVPAVVPNMCTRMDLLRKGAASQDARGVILSCVGCHLNDRPSRQQPGPTSLFWPRRRSGAAVRLTRGEASGWTAIKTGRSDVRTLIS
jgi:hypothetical protein